MPTVKGVASFLGAMRWTLALAFLGLAIAVSGCAGSDSADDGGESPTDGVDGGPAMDPYAEPAEWRLGQWFEYRTQSPEGDGEDVTLVVTDVGADNYTLDTTGRDMAAFHAESEISFLGSVAASDLSGRQGETPVRFFRFPLNVGDQWTTEWDGETRTIDVVEDREDFRTLTASADGVVRVDYSYRPEAGFFGHNHFLDEDGSAMFTMTLADWGENYTGAYVRATFTELFSTIGGGGPSGEDFMVPDETQELVLRYNVTCPEATTGAWRVSFTPLNSMAPHEEGHEASGECPEGVDAEVVLANPPPGPWEYQGTYAGLTPSGSVGTDHGVSGHARNFQEFSLTAS